MPTPINLAVYFHRNNRISLFCRPYLQISPLALRSIDYRYSFVRNNSLFILPYEFCRYVSIRNWNIAKLCLLSPYLIYVFSRNIHPSARSYHITIRHLNFSLHLFCLWRKILPWTHCQI